MLGNIFAFFLLLFRLWIAYTKAFYRLFVSPSQVSVYGKVVLITGGGSGLGRQMAMRLAAEGARLVLWDISEKGNEHTAELIQTTYPDVEIHTYTVDVTNRELVKTSALRVQIDVGRVYMLINNAGVLVGESLLDLKDDDIKRTININLLSAFWICPKFKARVILYPFYKFQNWSEVVTLRAFLPAMLEANHGHIVTTCSTGGITAVHRLTDYCASKYGIYGLDEALESELRQVYCKGGIRQTLVCPHFLDTGLIHSVEQRGQALLDTTEAAYVIVDGILRQERYVYFPEIFWLSPLFKQLLPHAGRLAFLDFLKIRIPSQDSSRLHED